jgi:transposase
MPDVIDIATERDINVLRQVALLQDREIQRLHHRLAALMTAAGGDTVAIQQELEALRDQLAQRNRALFGDSSEQRRSDGPSGASTRPPRGRGHGPSAQPRLPVVEETFTLPDGDRPCPQCGGQLEPMAGQCEEADEITVIERHFCVTRQRRQKYRCRCNGHVATAPGPVKLQPGARYSPAFAIEVAASKYLDHVPLERQVRMMAREGLDVTSQTLWDQIEILARTLQPTCDAIRHVVLAAPVIGADETRWRMMRDTGAGGTSRWWAWCLTSPDAVYFQILKHRSEAAARLILGRYGGVVMADGYGAYDALARGEPGCTLAHCWAHVRRKFLETADAFPTASAEALDLIAELYAVERAALEQAGPDADARLRARADLRASRSTLVIARLQAWALAQRVLPQGGLGRAIAYMLGLWAGLTRFLTDPRIPLDNNATERAIRGPVVGRKNFYGARSQRGTEVAALFYTLFETAKQRHVEPKAYLHQAVMAALVVPGTVTLPAPSAQA